MPTRINHHNGGRHSRQHPYVPTTRIDHGVAVLTTCLSLFLIFAVAVAKPASETAIATTATTTTTVPFGLDHGTSTPVLVVKGLRDAELDILAARVYDPSQPSAKDTDRPPLPKLYDLTPVILPRVDAESGEVRILAVPEFQLNQTSQLRVALWYPCYHRPEGVELLLMPCFFQSLSRDEYVAGTAATSTHEGRRVVFHMRHHAPPTAKAASSSNNDTASPDQDDPTSESLFDASLGMDDVSPTTRVTCWLPETDALLKRAHPVKVEEGSHWIRMRSLHYSERREGMFANRDDPLPAVWYDYEVVPHGEVDIPTKDVLIRGRKYCRSWLWVTVPETHSHKWLIHHRKHNKPTDYHDADDL